MKKIFIFYYVNKGSEKRVAIGFQSGDNKIFSKIFLIFSNKKMFLGSCSKLKFYIFSKSMKKIVKYIINNLRKTGEKKLQFILYYTRYLLINGHFWEPKMFTVHCWHKISLIQEVQRPKIRSCADATVTLFLLFLVKAEIDIK